MANATLTITGSVTNGAMSRQAELQLLKRAIDLALEDARSGGGQKTSGSPYLGEYAASGVSVSWTYSPLAGS